MRIVFLSALFTPFSVRIVVFRRLRRGRAARRRACVPSAHRRLPRPHRCIAPSLRIRPERPRAVRTGVHRATDIIRLRTGSCCPRGWITVIRLRLRRWSTRISGRRREPVLVDYSNVPLPAADAAERTRGNGVERRSADGVLDRLADHSVVAAIAYWVDGDTLHWVSRDAKQNRMSLSLVDREFSKQLNDERHVEFRLPPVK